MDRIDHATADDSSGVNLFTEGVPGVTPATRIIADWLNDVQEEVMAVIEDADGGNLTPDPDSRTQLKEAITNMVSSGTAGAVLTTTNQTVNGIKTFGSIPVLPATDPTTTNQATRKSYVDNKVVHQTSAPSSPFDGQVWIDNTNNKQPLLKSYEGALSAFKLVGGLPVWYGKIPSDVSIPVSETVIDINEVYNSDSTLFSWSTGADELTVNSAGVYAIWFSSGYNNASTTNHTGAAMFAYYDSGAGDVLIADARGTASITGSSNSGIGGTYGFALRNCASGEKLQWKWIRAGGGGITAINTTTVFAVIKLQ